MSFMEWRIFDDMEQCTTEEVQRLLNVVSPQRANKAMSYQQIFGQYACLKSYEILHQLLQTQGVIDTDTFLEFEYGTHGKPILKNFPDIHFNISHCKRAIAVAIDRNPIGIDVERLLLPSNDFLHYTMNETELNYIRTAECPEVAFAILWTQKEAFLKMQGKAVDNTMPTALNTLNSSTTFIKSWVNEQKQYACTIVSQQ